MKNILLILMLFFLKPTSFQVYRSTMVDNELAPYIQDFKLIVKNKKYDDRLNNISIIFEDIPKESDNYQTLAYCGMMFVEDPIIYVDRKSYKDATPMSKEFTILHEMGHCVCNRFHTEQSKGITGFLERILFNLGLVQKKGFLPDGCPSSLMHPFDFSESCMMRHYFYYIEEYKKGCN